MDRTPLQPQLHMILPHMGGLPRPLLPEGYGSRTYRPGDEDAWEAIIDDSFAAQPGTHSFAAILRGDPAFRADRIWFVTHDGEPVGTASAYTRPSFMVRAGMLHYVGVRPSHTGRRLGRAVSLLALHTMVRDGHPCAWLSTDDFRLPAIQTYLRLGFRPLLVHENQRDRWRSVFRALGNPGRFAPLISLLSEPLYAPPAPSADPG